MLLHCAEPHRSCACQRESTLGQMHLDVISQTNKINMRNKRNLAESKTDLVEMLQKKQCNVRLYDAIKYFMYRMMSRDYPGQHQYLTIGRWTQRTEQLWKAEYSCRCQSDCEDVRCW